jgi:hypothetical protein
VLVDPTSQISTRRQELLHEADRERLAALLPHPHPHPRSCSTIRHDLALAVARLANWIEQDTRRYVPPSDPGPADWVTDSARV